MKMFVVQSKLAQNRHSEKIFTLMGLGRNPLDALILVHVINKLGLQS